MLHGLSHTDLTAAMCQATLLILTQTHNAGANPPLRVPGEGGSC